MDSWGQVFVADTGNGTVRKITPAGVVSTLAGAAGVYPTGSTVDGVGSAARFHYPHAVVVDNAGNVFVTDSRDNLVRKVTAAGAVSTFAGSGAAQTVDGMGRAAALNQPGGITIDSAGNLYVAEWTGHTVRKITPSGLVTTHLGTPGVRGSESASGAVPGLDFPHSLAIDAAGNVFVVEGFSPIIRKFTPTGEVLTVAGTPKSYGITIGGLPGSLSRIGGIAIDAKGVLHLSSEACILKVQLPQ